MRHNFPFGNNHQGDIATRVVITPGLEVTPRIDVTTNMDSNMGEDITTKVNELPSDFR